MIKKSSKLTLLYIGLLIFLTIPVCTGFFSTNLLSAHDSLAGLIRALSMNKFMGHGQLLVRWAPEVNWGYGYPMFNFYPPLFSFISVLFFHLTHNMGLAINCACVLFWALSGIGMFLLAREFWGDQGGMLSALLYVYAPYHIIDLYVRGAFAEFSAFAFFPFLLLSILKMSRKKGGLAAFLLGVGSVFGLSLTHNIMSMLFFPIAVVFMLYLFFSEKKTAWIIPAMSMFMIGLMMSAFFWVPALIEKKFLNLSFLISMRYDFHNSFITLGELFWPFNAGNVDNISFQVGLIYSLLCLGSLACLPKIFKINKQSGRSYVFFLIIGITAVFFTLPYSTFFWEKISMLSFIQFPWRFLAIIVFAMSFLCGSTVLVIKDQKLRMILMIIVGSLIILISLKSTPKLTFISPDQSIGDFLAMGEGEYTPKWVVIPPDNPPDRKFDIFSGEGRLAHGKAIDPVHYETKYLGLQPSVLYFNTFYFPGWQVFIDGQATEPNLDNPYGLIMFKVPVGEHDIQIIFGQTNIRKIGNTISFLGLILLLIGIIFFKIRKAKIPCLPKN